MTAFDQTAARYRPNHLVAVWLNGTVLESERYRSAERRRQLGRDLGTAMQAVPGVVETAFTFPPLLSRTAHVGVQRPDAEGAESNVQLRYVSSNYLATVGIPLVAGRSFGLNDGLPGRRVIIVSRSFARMYLRDANSIGRSVRVARAQNSGITGAPSEIVGVVEDAQLPDAETGALDPVPLCTCRTCGRRMRGVNYSCRRQI